jgi:hypothetical protein
MMDYNNYNFVGIHGMGFVWMVLLFWIFADPYLPGQNKKDTALDLLKNV